jgi:hypothetical protein
LTFEKMNSEKHGEVSQMSMNQSAEIDISASESVRVTVAEDSGDATTSARKQQDDTQSKLLATTKDWTSEDLDLRLNENAVLLSRWTLLLDRNGKYPFA